MSKIHHRNLMKKAWASLLSLLLFYIFVFSPFDLFSQTHPDQIPGLQLWLRADSNVVINGDTVVSWNDCNGNANNATQTIKSKRPKYIESVALLNNLPAIRFDGIDDFMSFTEISNIRTCFFVIKHATGTSTNFAPILGHSLHYDFMGNTANHIFNTDYASQYILNGQCYINGTTISAANLLKPTNYTIISIITTGNVSAEYITNDRNLYGWWKGDYAEIILYNQPLSIVQHHQVEDYLQNKYAPPVNLGPDININYGFCSKTIDAGSRFTHFLWSTGDTTQTISISHSGSYSVTVTNLFNQISSDTINVTYPVVALADTFFCSGSSVVLSTGIIGNYTYNWSNSETTPSVIINSPGNYAVTITDSLTCSVSSNVITVSEDNFPAIASLGADTNLCSGNSIGLLEPSPLPGGLTYAWSTLENMPHIMITDSGNYSVTVTDMHECVARDTIHIAISGTAPDANFSYNLGCSGNTTSFSNSSSPSGDAWLWNFGDGQTDTSQNPTHTYTNKGIYMVSLKVSEGLCSNTILKSIYINGTPTAAFSADTACANHAYNFTDHSSSNNGTIISWDWDFGDATMHSTLQNPTHTYASSGSYNITLTVATDSACQANIQHPIFVVNTAVTPAFFTLYQPSNNFVTSNSLIDFGWNPSFGSQSYTLEYSTDSLFLNNVVSIPNINASTYQLSLPLFQNYFWRVTAMNICGDQITSETRKIILFSPAFNSDLQLWLKADSGVILNGNKLSQWMDCSGNGNNAFQSTITQQPQFINNIPLLNNLPAIRFDGIDDFMSFTEISNIRTCFFVIKHATGTSALLPPILGHHSLYDFIGNTGSQLFHTGFLNPNILNGQGFINDNFIAPASMAKPINYSIISLITTGNVSAEYITNDRNLYGWWKGDYAEIILYNQPLSIVQHQLVEDYLQNKYAPPVNLGSDINIAYGLCDTILDAGGRFTHFLWSTGDTTQTITVTRSGQYSVTATNIFGQVSHDDVLVNIPSFMVHDTAFCLGDTLALSGSLGTSYHYLWLPDSVTTKTFAITHPGNYSLTVFDTIGCQRTKSFTVTADSFAIIASLGTDKKICKGDYIGLVSGAQQAASYLWSDNSANSLLTINDNYGTTPIYSVTVSSYNNCTAHDTIQLTVNGVKPQAAFISDSVCFGNANNFTNQSSVVPPFNIISSNWSFGDSTFSSASNPVHQYTGDGFYPVTLVVTTDSGCVNSTQKTVKVFSNPSVNFMPYIGCSGVEISFLDKTQCPYGIVTNWQWNFNDTFGGGHDTSTLQNPVYIFDSAGTYPVKLISVSNAGCIDSVVKNVMIKVSPKVDFTVTHGCVGKVIYFNDITQLQPWETVNYRKWCFGDGTYAYTPNPSHIFSDTGTYLVSLTVRTSTGCQVTEEKPIVVGVIPVPEFTYSKNCKNSTTQFADISSVSSGTIDHWNWNFDGLGVSLLQNPGFIFPDTGTYQVGLMVTSNHDCVDSIKIPVKVFPAPKADFIFSPEYGIPPLAVNFTNTSTNADSYLWLFGDGFNDNIVNPAHTYFSQGVFTALLTAYSTIGCIDTNSQRVYVLPTTIDIKVLDANLRQIGNILQVSADLMNVGTRKIEHIDLSMQMEHGNVFHEQWEGELFEGESMHFVFDASPELPEGIDVNYLCVKANLPDQQEEIINNNEKCVVLTDEFLAGEPYPNPLINTLNLVYILPFADNVVIELYDGMGNKVKELFNGVAQEGYNVLQIDLSALPGGVYTYKILFRDKVQRKKFVKM